MQSIALSGIVLAGFCAAAQAQTTAVLYGNIDTAVDVSNKTGGSVGTVGGASPAFLFPPGGVGRKLRVTQSLTRTNTVGFKGREDLGSGWAGGFLLESQPGSDDGTVSQDGRFFGKQAWVHLTTPAGELRLGRQYAPIFFVFAANTPDGLGGTDVFTAGLVTNTLQIRQDNQVSYWAKGGPWALALSFSPNAGVSRIVSPARGASVSAATGSILGAANAGVEAADSTPSGERGRSNGLYASYGQPSFNLSLGYHANTFNVPVLSAAGSIFELSKYRGYAVAGKYVLSEGGASVHAMFHDGRYADAPVLNLPGLPALSLPGAGQFDPRISTRAVGARVPWGNTTFLAAAGESRFQNFTRGKNLGAAVGADYAFSKRTTLYSRLAVAKDRQGDVLPVAGVTASGVRAIAVAGGPDSVLSALGLRETPEFNGLGISPGGSTSIVAIGLRHAF